MRSGVLFLACSYSRRASPAVSGSLAPVPGGLFPSPLGFGLGSFFLARLVCLVPARGLPGIGKVCWSKILLGDCAGVKGYQKKGLRLLFRGDAAFAKPELYEYLEQGKIGYAIRLPANQVIQEQIQPLLERPTEWPSREPSVSYHDYAYQAQSWHLPRRVVAKVEWHQGELFPRVGFIVTNLSYPPKGIVRFYNGRGTAEQWIKEGKYALNWTRLSCHKFVATQVRLWLFVLTYNLGNFMRRLVLPEDMKHWTLTSLQTRLIKTGGRLVRHARRLVFQLAEVLVTREMLTGILERISRLRLAPG